MNKKVYPYKRVSSAKGSCEYSDNNRRGFTLMEILIVVAIIAILAVIAIPLFNSQLDSTREATCQANRRALKAFVTTNLMTDPNYATSDFIKNEEFKDSYFCPSGGDISVAFKESGAVSVSCSIHGSDDTVVDYDKFAEELAKVFADTSSDVYKDVLAKLADSKSFDYPLPQGDFAGYSNKLVEYADGLGIDLKEGSWRLYKWHANDYSFYQTPSNVLSLSVGDTISVTRWDVNDTGVTAKYSGETKVIQSASGYNIITPAKKSELTLES